jgi:hypothetical protein
VISTSTTPFQLPKMHMPNYFPRLLSLLAVLPLAVAAPAVAGLSTEAGEARRVCMGGCARSTGQLDCWTYNEVWGKPRKGEHGGWVCALY